MTTLDKAKKLADHYGFDLEYFADHPDYRERKKGIFLITDRRSKLIAAAYSTAWQCLKYFDRF
ncbi:hypothetical protein H6F44_20660 [Pseudanabaena sp. FACHB-1277]|uniref:Uncharacterized protein n=1 Tax=Pseudanabaena cinerea FACHB-1277 TaxID=2949581 RepID=A0A926Z883_9CYAN|nr:hypothetical protein [Pseudanabaena cinerea]MBD2152510.1 hypothetical protein [Pseudanabaena cinerea FACHB-1277]